MLRRRLLGLHPDLPRPGIARRDGEVEQWKMRREHCLVAAAHAVPLAREERGERRRACRSTDRAGKVSMIGPSYTPAPFRPRRCRPQA